jgi:hypothetical protein
MIYDELKNYGDSIVIKGRSQREWCTAILTDVDQNQHIYVSIGTKISLKTAT